MLEKYVLKSMKVIIYLVFLDCQWHYAIMGSAKSIHNNLIKFYSPK